MDGDPLDALVLVGEPTFPGCHIRNEIEHFFQVYKDLEGHQVVTEGYEDRASALRTIEQARARAVTP